MFKTVGVGRMVSDPVLESKTTGNGKEVNMLRFTLAFNEVFKVGDEKRETAHYLDFEAWHTGAETIAKYAHKGTLMMVSGKPRQNRWVDKENGINRSRIVHRVEEFKFLSPSNHQQEDAPESD